VVEECLLAARNLRVTAPGGRPILEGVDLQVPSATVTALFGPSGAGKSFTLLALAGLLPRGFSLSGSVLLAGREVVGLPPPARRRLLGREIGLVLQEPGTALNPVLPVGVQVAEGIRYHRGLTRREARRESRAALEREGLTPASRIARLFPHQLSGGMRQRVLLASVLSLRPRVLLLDEPLAALDTVLVAGLLRRLHREVTEGGVALLAVFHDLRLASLCAGRACFLAGGRVLEAGPAERLFHQPERPETARFLGREDG